MGNHIHIIALVEDPTTRESFMERCKCETAHAINRLFGRRQVTVWCEGYDSPAILTSDDLVGKLAYEYANRVRAHRAASISEYQGVSSWAMFTSRKPVREVKRIRKTFLAPIATGKISTAVLLQEASLVERQARESLTFTLSPNAWTAAFPHHMTPETINEKVSRRVREIEADMASIRDKEGIPLPSAFEVSSQPIDTPYEPTKFGRRMWCIYSDIPLRIAFISFIKNLREKARKVRLQWIHGNSAEPCPIGLFPPTQPMLANILPAYFRRSLTTV